MAHITKEIVVSKISFYSHTSQSSNEKKQCYQISFYSRTYWATKKMLSKRNSDTDIYWSPGKNLINYSIK